MTHLATKQANITNDFSNMKQPMLGIDFGSSSVKMALLDGSRIVWTKMQPSRSEPRTTAIDMLKQLGLQLPEDVILKLGVTGASALFLAPHDDDSFIVSNEVACTVAGVGIVDAASQKNTRTVIDMGGQFSKWIRVDASKADLLSRVKDFEMNGLCAAGSGTFMEQQAARLKMSAQEIGVAAADAPVGAKVAGRCSVFAKSDMIHLQQKGTPVNEIAYGLCLALARTFSSQVLKGRDIEAPVAMVGGGASNPGLVRALKQVLGLSDVDMVIPDHHSFVTAIGAAWSAADCDGVRLESFMLQLQQEPTAAAVAVGDELPPFAHMDYTQSSESNPVVVPDGAMDAHTKIPVFMGIDVGSVSTNVVLLNQQFESLEELYVPTQGTPLDALNGCFKTLKDKYGDRLLFKSVGATGSGRYLVEQIAGVDVVKNEITAQLKGALHYVPDATSIFEIGGQDSKFISTGGGQMKDFEMNKICAAGTGSFLEEQAERLGIQIRGEFTEVAMTASGPVDLGSKCTVFMDTELVKALRNNASKSDLCAGLAYSVARNYLEKVVAGRDIGEKIVFQGGTSKNGAVVKAFELLLGKEIVVHPHGNVSGAIGAAILGATEMSGDTTCFFGLDACADYTVKSFMCKSCENLCQVNRIRSNARVAHFGDVCEKFTVKDRRLDTDAAGPQWQGLFADRESLLQKHSAVCNDATARPIGLLRSSLNMELLPFWTTLLVELGYRPVVASQLNELHPSSAGALPTEVCLPLKIAMSQIGELLDSGRVEQVFVPSVQHLPQRQPKDRPNTCLYAQFLPDMAALQYGDKIAAPMVCIANSKRMQAEAVSQISKALSVKPGRTERAWQKALQVHRAFSEERQAMGKALLDNLPPYSVVVMGKPYNVHDAFANLNLARHLERAGLSAIPMDLLPLDDIALTDEWSMLPWNLNRDQARVLQLASRYPNVFPVHVSSYGCGPDAFTLKHLERAWGNKPRLFLEFDEHRGEAGLVTRIEAFGDEIRDYVAHHSELVSLRYPTKRLGSNLPTDLPFLIPYTTDHVYAYTGVFKTVGIKTEILPPPDMESVRLGQKVSSERECHPYSIIAGDMVKAANNYRDDAVFFMQGTRLPCLMSQYGDGFRSVLEKLNVTHIKALDPHPGELGELLGPLGIIKLYEGLTAIDILINLGCMFRPFEKEAGATNAALAACYQRIEHTIAERGSLKKCLRQCVDALEVVPRNAPQPRPVVGVTGDLYTRINPAGNAALFERLESDGCVVWPAPFFAGSTDFELPQDARRELERKSYSRALQEASFATILKSRARKLMAAVPRKYLDKTAEPSFSALQRYAREYVHDNTNHLIRGIVAKMADFADRGADGVISAVGVGCMVGVCADSTIGRIRDDFEQIPMTTIAYGGSQGPAQQIQLETFIHQVKQRFNERQGA